MPHSNTLSQSLKHSHSNTEISHLQPLGVQQKSPLPSPLPSNASLKHSLLVQILSLSLSNTEISHPKPLGVQQKSPPQMLSSFLTIGFRRSPHQYLENPFCPYQQKFKFFQV